MAAVSIPPSPQTNQNTMSTRRPPLANVPNATNSPHRPMLVPAKRARHANTQLEIPYGQPPPKKQALEATGTGTDHDARSPPRSRPSAYNADSKLFSRRASNAQPSAFEKKLVAARDKEKQPQVKGSRHEKPSAETLDTIRQWQRHYRKAFPQFVFYFDSIPVDLRGKFARQVIALGAREEKFFSRLVTHVVTSRPIPPESDTSPTELTNDSADQLADGPHTVNPSLLEKNADAHMSLKGDARREQSSMDVLHRARQMGMKIWALEKLQRMISTINDGEISGHGHSTRNNNTGGGNARAKGENDLSQVLRDERVNGPSDRDPFSSNKEMVMFKGYFIYIHEIGEKTKPVMVRDYPKVAKRQEGAWPQFRSAPLGKCPFVEEPPSRRAARQRPRQVKEKKPAKPVPQNDTRKQEDEPEPIGQEDAYAGDEQDDALQEAAPQEQPETQKVPIKPESPKKSSESFVPPQVPSAGPFFMGREPAASGVQPSNMTSAIRSQMISSTTAAQGAKAGVSKEVHELKRKVLEKGNIGVPGAPAHRPEPSVGLKMAAGRPKKTNQDKPGHTQEEDTTQSEGNGATKRRFDSRKGRNPDEERRRDPKPGYCENCREKFDDFEEHTQTRKHRKFALTKSNWAELDALLDQLERPLKEEYEYE